MDINLIIDCVKPISDICVGSKTSNREKILEWEEFAKTQEQLEIPVKHYIHGGMYAREITIPKDTYITGQIYKFNHFDIMISGDISVSTDTEEAKRFTGYNLFKGLSGKKRAGYSHEDTTWVTFHPFIGSDGDAVQEFITAENFEELNDFNVALNRSDYMSLVNSIDMTDDDIMAQVENDKDLIDMPLGFIDLYVSTSEIEGKGFFSVKDIQTGDFICPSRLGDKRTPAGRYVNHALQPNAQMMVNGKDVELVAIRDIEAGEEITVNYRDVLTSRNNSGDLSCQE